MKLSDFVINFLSEQKIDKVFGVTGGGVVHLFDSLDKHDKIEPIFVHHEQTAALAAQAYARINNIGACIVTTGPGGTNAITGLLAAWQDSIPCIFISGQSKIEHLSLNTKVRQVGIQEFNISNLVKDITKFSITVDNPQLIKFYLQKALYLAKEGRPGPVWIDIPLNFQWEDINIEQLKDFKEPALKENDLSLQIYQTLEFINNAKQPLVLCGNGVHISKAEEEFQKFIHQYQLPLVTTWNTSDIIENENGLYCGRIGIAGQRGANLAVQNCDLLIVIGSHLSMPLTTATYANFAPNAKIIMIDIDQNELDFETVKIDLKIKSDVKEFLLQLNNLKPKSTKYSNWMEYISKYKFYNRIDRTTYKEYCNPYKFLDILSRNLIHTENIVIDGGGTALYMPFQTMKVKTNQRMIVSSAIAAMGTGIPDSIGAYFANKRKTICIIGDGSMQFNIQELQTIYHHHLPIKIVILNNDGYLAIRHTQKDWLEESYVGSANKGGISIPSYEKVVKAYNIKYLKVIADEEVEESILNFLLDDCPCVLEVMIPFEQELIPRVGFEKDKNGVAIWKTLGEMAPFLDKDELLSVTIRTNK